MAVYDGTPSIRLEGDEQSALALIPQAKALLYRVQKFKETAGVNTFSMSRRVGEHATIYVLSAGDQHIIHIMSDPDVPEELRIDIPEIGPGTTKRVLDFYSGVVFDGVINSRRFPGPNDAEVGVLENFAPTTSCRLFHDELRVAGAQPTPRLAVEPWGAYSQELGNPNGIPKFSQYTRLRASMYSGSMAKVVQLLMGMGRLRLSNIEKEPYLKAVRTSGLQIRYDWRFIRTHGVVWAADNKPWLVEISQGRGVLARPLPVFEESTTEAFAAQAVLSNDADMQYVLDGLGFLPTGEAFPPRSADLEALITSGDVLRLMGPDQLTPFYSCSAYSSSMGWVFSASGREAHNTAYYFGDDGFQRSVWYQISIAIGTTQVNRLPNQPIASGSADLRLQREGFIYCPPAPSTSYARYVPIKYHEPMLFGLLSHEGVPDIRALGLDPPYVDTPMFVTFVNEELHVVSYFRDNQSYPGGVEDGIAGVGCLFNGEWVKTTTYSDFRVSPGVYTNVFDPRENFSASQREEKRTSKDRGWGAPSSGFFDRRHSSLRRTRRFEQTYKIKDTDSRSNAAAAAVPEYARNAYYVAFAETRRTGFDYVNTFWQGLIDVTAYYGTNDGLSSGLLYGSSYIVERYDVPGAPIDNPDGLEDFAVARELVTSDECRTEHANEGPWFTLGDKYNVEMPGTPFGPSTQAFGPVFTSESAILRLYSNGVNGYKDIQITPSRVFNHWMTPSPDPLTAFIQNIRTEYSVLGADAVIYDEGLSSYENSSKLQGVAPTSIDDNQFPTFIGVNGP